jgi:ABC-2 type transport system permease protein
VTAAIRAELLKVRTTRLLPGLLAAAAGLNLLMVVLETSRAGGTGDVPSLATPGGLRDVITGTYFALLMAPVFGAAVAAGEFRQKTATDTYLDEPDRVHVLIAKVIAATAGGLAFGLTGAVVATGTGLAFAAAKGYHVTQPASHIVGFGLGAVLAGGLLAAVGASLGSLVRSQLAVTVAIVVWGIGIETLLGGVSPSLLPYLPFTAAGTMGGVSAGGSMPSLPAGFRPLPFAAVAALLTGLAMIIAAAALRTTIRRDIV